MVRQHHRQNLVLKYVYIFLVVIGHAILLHSLCKAQNKVAGIACMIKLMYLHEVCGSRLAV